MTKQFKVQYDRRKRWVQYRLRKDMNVLADIPLSIGGTSNCGNLWRRIFKKCRRFAWIVGVSVELIEGIHAM